MEKFISDAMVIESALFSFLLALFMTWLGLSGLFRVLPATMHFSPARSSAVAGRRPEPAKDKRIRQAA